VAKVFEAGIRAHPEDWHMLQRVFVADLDLARLARAEAKARAVPIGAHTVTVGRRGTGTGRGPGEMAGGRTALDGQPNGSGP
jgi:phosphatidylinositol dimannoside acyltransferase